MSHSHLRRKSTCVTLSGWWLRCLLVLAAWQAAIPFAHAGCSVLCSQVQPDQHDHQHGSQHEQETPLLEMEACESLTDSLHRADLTPSISSSAEYVSADVVLANNLGAGRTHFFDSFAPSLPLPLRFSILRS